jgi:DNA-directed RNA polymerase specialized sigma24 family protein
VPGRGLADTGVEGKLTNEAFEQIYYPRYESVIRAIARKVGQRNEALIEDLYQEGLIALWDLDPAQAARNEDAYIRQAVKFRMIDYMRRERPALYESLTAHLERGEQVVRDEDTGHVRIVGARETRRRVPFPDEDDSRAAHILENDPGSLLEE